MSVSIETVKELRRLQSEADRGGSYAASWLDEAANLIEQQSKSLTLAQSKISELSTKVASEHRLYEITFDNQTRWMDKCGESEKHLTLLGQRIAQQSCTIAEKEKEIVSLKASLLEWQAIGSDKAIQRPGIVLSRRRCGMTEQETRITFAKRQGWKEAFCQSCMMVIGPHSSHPIKWCNCKESILPPDYPNPTDHNHVHAALMGMSDEEWKQFSSLLLSTGEGYWNGGMENIVTLILKLPLSTLVECYLEATKGRVK